MKKWNILFNKPSKRREIMGRKLKKILKNEHNYEGNAYKLYKFYINNVLCNYFLYISIIHLYYYYIQSATMNLRIEFFSYLDILL